MSVHFNGQVYNYNPISLYDVETNPSALASDRMNNRIGLLRYDDVSSNEFSHASLSFSKYFESSFIGTGISLNTTRIGKSGYDHIALSAGYRNLLLNKIYVKIGASYKIIRTADVSSTYDYLEVRPSNDSNNRRIQENVNLALSLSTGGDAYYLSFEMLNRNLPWRPENEEAIFPTYYVLNAGNLMTLFDKERRHDISYTMVQKMTTGGPHNQPSHYVYIKIGQALTRRSHLQYGSRLGFVENRYYQFTPFLSYWNAKLIARLAYNFHLEKMNFDTLYYSSIQLSIFYNL